MCGVAGVFAYGDTASPVDREELLRIREAMRTRGPDGAGLWVSDDGRVGLAHRRLAIIDLSAEGAQPMATPDGRLRVTFNGEIYNYRELRSELEVKGYHFRSQSDTEVLLHLYADRGAEMVHALRGMYAFGIWDAREHQLFLARDPFGIKPLYYADQGGTLRFASQVKALLRGGAVSTAAEPAGSTGFLLWGAVPEPFTLYRDICALPAGHTLALHQSGPPRVRVFFQVRDELLRAQEAGLPKIGLQETLDYGLRDSIRHHLVSDVPVGVFLSAGIDSGLVIALASEQGSPPLNAITLGFDDYRGTQEDEVPLAEIVARRYGANHQTASITRGDFEGSVGKILEAMDQPSIDGVNTWLVAGAAARSGMKVALSGLGGDELFAGYPSFRDVPRLARWLWPTRLVRPLGRALRALLLPLLKPHTSPKYAGLFEYAGSFSGSYLLRRALFMPWEAREVLDPATVRTGLERLDTLGRLHASVAGLRGARCKVAALEMQWYMRNQLLRDADWAGMAHSVEIRVPFVDVPLFRALAPWLAGGREPSKTDAISVLRTPLPQEVARRPKTGFSIPVAAWTANVGPESMSRGLRAWAQRVLSQPTLQSFHTE